MHTASSPLLPKLTDWHGAAELHPYFVCDVFTSEPLRGNQLGVFVDGRPFTPAEMQRLAREMNFAETVFLLPPQEGGDVWVRIFTCESELPFAGLAVLGTALVSGAALGKGAVTLETGAGRVPVRLDASFGWMQQPIPVWEPFERAPELLAALGVTASRLPVDVYRNGPRHVFVALENEAEVAALKPDLPALHELGVGANCFAGSGLSWKTRMFYPAVGITEDPATGSAAGPLAVHLARHGQISFGQEIEIRQGAELGRPSTLYAFATGSAERIESVEVGGGALIVAEGVFRIARSRSSNIPIGIYTADMTDKPNAHDALLEATNDLIYAGGITGTGVDAIAAQAGVTKRTLYQHFGSKDRLVSEALTDRSRRALLALDTNARRRSAETGEPAILALFDVIENALRTKTKAGCAFINASLEINRPGHPVREAALAHLRAREELVRQLLVEAGVQDADLAAQLTLLVDGAYAVGGSRRDPAAARNAKAAAAALLAGRVVS